MIHAIGDWLYWFTGSVGSGSQYGFWSGFGSDVGEVAIIGGLLQVARKHNCHQKGCWRMGRHPVGPYVVCRKHHPAIPSGGATAADIADAHIASNPPA